MPIRVGLTGGIASGKSTVARRLAEAGVAVVDADELVADLYQPGRAGAQTVRELFGADVLDESGAVDHTRLATVVFSEPAALERLEEAIHPLVRREFAAIAAAASGPVVLEATLLVEAGYAPDFDLVVTVEADKGLRLERAVARGLTEEEARARLEAQSDRNYRSQAAHRVIENDGTRDELHESVDELVREIQKLEAASQ